MSDPETDLDNTFVLDKANSPQVKSRDIWGRFVRVDAPGSNIDFSDNEIWFGRSKDLPEATRFADKRMSSKHFRVFLENDQVFIEDNSSNGTFLSGERLAKGARQPLKNGDEVTLFTAKQEDGVPQFVFQDKRKNRSSIIIKASSPPPVSAQSPPSSSQKAAPPSSSSSPAIPTTSPAAPDPVSGKRKHDDEDEDEKPKAKKQAVDEDEDPALEENLTCGICQDILYKAVSLIPCLHSFCCSCVSDWVDRSTDCPECRKPIKGASKPHVLQNLVDAYLAKYPKKKRSEEEMKALDPKSDIEALGKTIKANAPDDDDDGSDSDSDSGIIQPLQHPPHFGFNLLNQARRCRQCPPGDGGPFTCPPNGLHLICTACARNMPDRTGAPGIQQRCDICHRVFCQLYWGCTAPNAADTLKKLEDFQFPQIPLGPQGPFGGNDYERQILVDYLRTKGISANDSFKACLAKLDEGAYKYSRHSMTQNFTSQSSTCHNCATSVFSDLLFEYTKAIPKGDLPARQDCFYGKNCRTQHHNFNHKTKFNHVCDQTRF